MYKRKRQVIEEEDCNQLKFGSEFESVECLLISEVRVLLEVARDRKRKESGESSISNIMQKTIEYCQKFSKFSNKQTVKHVRQTFPAPEYHQFEMAQLANLCCETAEEAQAMIPSLQRKNENELQHSLNELSSLRATI